MFHSYKVVCKLENLLHVHSLNGIAQVDLIGIFSTGLSLKLSEVLLHVLSCKEYGLVLLMDGIINGCFMIASAV